jgi:chromosomal replication initiation ATPase DnaA
VGQLPLPLAYHAATGATDFVHAAANADAVAWLSGPPAARTLLVGPPASGKSHLGGLFSAQHGATLIDDAETVAQEALFHAWNAASEAAPILFTARSLPRQWVQLPDLGSRLAATPTLIIGPPDDALLATLLVKHFADRGVRVSPDVIAFVTLRIERSFAAVAATVAALDAAALAGGREVTIPLARAVLEGQGELLG